MRAKGWALRVIRVMRVMRATVKMLRIFICYNYIRMKTTTRATERDKYDRNIKFLQRLHKLSPRRFLESANQKPNWKNKKATHFTFDFDASQYRTENFHCLKLGIFKRESVSKRYEYQNWVKVIPQYCIAHNFRVINALKLARARTQGKKFPSS